VKILTIGKGSLSDRYGGGQVYFRNLINGLLGGEHSVEYLDLTFLSNSFPEVKQQTANGVLSHRLAVPNSWKYLSARQNDETMEILVSVFRTVAPDIIHAHAWKNIAALAAKKANIACIVTAHHGGIVCPAGALLNADDEICHVPASDAHCLKCCTKSVPGWRLWYPILKALPIRLRLWAGERLRQLPFILFLTPLGTISCNIRDKMQSMLDIGQNAKRIIAPSPAIAEALVHNGFPDEKIVVVPHGIPLPHRLPLRPDFGSGPLRFLFVGRINHVKGVHVMLEAFAALQHDKYELHIVGGAVTKPESRYMARLKRKFSSVNAVWHGSRPHEAIMQHLAWCDLMVHPAISLEVFGLTIAEALAVGRPVIATRCGGAEAQIRDGENGLLVSPNDAAALRQSIQSVLEDPSRLRRMAEQSAEVVSIERHVTVLERIYCELAQE
jgi:glycosyltransferase involved in cell wall biosynthesis